jgi:hypothetical protein
MRIKKQLTVAAVGWALAALSASASASLVFDGELTVGAQGFGNANRLLTISSKGNATFESGAIGISGGNIVSLEPGILDSLVYNGNGVRNAGGDTVNPLEGGLKNGIPTLGSLNWSTGSDVHLLFNAAENNDDGLNVTDVTLKFYSGNTVIAAIDGNFALASTVMGQGNAGYLISVDAAQQTFLNSTVFTGQFSDYRIALESTITGVSGGAESFSALTAMPIVSAVPEPETYAMMMAGLGLLGFTARRRNKKDKIAA